MYSKFLSWEWFSDPEMVQLFVWLLLKANYCDGRYQGVAIKRGQVLISRRKAAAELHMSERTFRTCLSRLKKTGEVTTQPTHLYTLVTICNYDSYQSPQGSDRPTTDPLPTHFSTHYNSDVTNNVSDYYTPQKSDSDPVEVEKPTHIYKTIDNIVVVEDARTRTREEMIEALRRDLYASPLKMKSALRAIRVHDVATLRQLCEEVFADWQLTDRGTVDWPHLRNQLIIKAEARQREEARLAAIPKPQQTVKEWRQQLAADVMKGVALNQALNNKKK